jgi:hypothetical protein
MAPDLTGTAALSRSETVEILAEVAQEVVAVDVSAGVETAAGAAGPRGEVPFWHEGLGVEVLPADCARIVAPVCDDTAGSGEGVRARRMREHLGRPATDAKEQAARFRAKRLVERGWLSGQWPGLFRPRTV